MLALPRNYSKADYFRDLYKSNSKPGCKNEKLEVSFPQNGLHLKNRESMKMVGKKATRLDGILT